ncbi:MULTISPECIES: MarR family transcriptional regulator [unclassified Enterococcus]|uniref:MarR family winged helix-turn-helix transcriptional regulator n=1 Tax=unclassified Enterococcus TaxID=2608891 RepID=UPI00155596F8|nr:MULTISPECIES: MarR family transcriptional regulator [unclassified Enterococcus]MBS7576428.1 MarR family transcriptional regulator [Enterococcus sp. MMGLQ5-2]MBS7583660.1 MarR family transcriptional regulator [Enterococcus sp. MMGLQ5-1]NPD11521.1 MarR family transcriptional regulator [Enterococcus sp. MMGLQ5-1]NPD36265.1 MarR family transcriptional regulator [Enterococcus sp. MMGLQ5-2]
MESQEMLIARKFKHFLHESREYLKKMGVSPPEGQNLLLMNLIHHDGMTPTEIGERMHIRSAAVAELLNKLEKNELIKREQDRKDRRRTRVLITELGREKVRQMRPNKEILLNLFSGLEQEEIDQLEHLIDKLRASLDERMKSDKDFSHKNK